MVNPSDPSQDGAQPFGTSEIEKSLETLSEIIPLITFGGLFAGAMVLWRVAANTAANNERRDYKLNMLEERIARMEQESGNDATAQKRKPRTPNPIRKREFEA